MIVREVKKQEDVDELFSVEYLEETITHNTIEEISNTRVSSTVYDTKILKGSKKGLRQKTAELILSYIQIMNSHK